MTPLSAKIANPKMLLAAMLAGSLVLGGCATTGSVKRAQARADQAFLEAQNGQSAAQRAQGSADNAMAAAGRAQTSADGAAQAAQAANAAATGASTDARSAGSQMAIMNARLRKLEAQVHKLKAKTKHHRNGKKTKATKSPESQPARFH